MLNVCGSAVIHASLLVLLNLCIHARPQAFVKPLVSTAVQAPVEVCAHTCWHVWSDVCLCRSEPLLLLQSSRAALIISGDGIDLLVAVGDPPDVMGSEAEALLPRRIDRLPRAEKRSALMSRNEVGVD